MPFTTTTIPAASNDSVFSPCPAITTYKNRHNRRSLPDLLDDALPLGPSGHLRAISVDRLPVKLTTSSIKIDLVQLDRTLTLPDVAHGPEEEDDGNSEPCGEEFVGSRKAGLAWGQDGADELDRLLAWIQDSRC